MCVSSTINSSAQHQFLESSIGIKKIRINQSKLRRRVIVSILAITWWQTEKIRPIKIGGHVWSFEYLVVLKRKNHLQKWPDHQNCQETKKKKQTPNNDAKTRTTQIFTVHAYRFGLILLEINSTIMDTINFWNMDGFLCDSIIMCQNWKCGIRWRTQFF